jgi:hypothetical protein
MSRVSVTLGRDEENTKLVLTVSVYSLTRKGQKANTQLDPGKYGTAVGLQNAVYVSGAACAEYLAEKYGERHDPQTCGKLAVEDFIREMRLIESLRAGVPAKVARLSALVIDPGTRSRLDRLRSELRRGGNPTSSDVAWVDNLLAAYSQNLQLVP